MGISRTVSNENSLHLWCEHNGKANLLQEWDYEKNGELKPEKVSYASNRKVWWKCGKGHSYLARIGNRAYLNRGCPYCSGRKVLEGYNDFKTWCGINEREDLLAEWHCEKNTVNPQEITAKNDRKVWWKCSLGHEWDATIGSRTNSQRPSGCPYCSNPPKRILVGFNDFESWCAENGKGYLLDEWDNERNAGLSTREVTYGSGKSVWWRCKRGHEWHAPVVDRTRGTGCPICSRTQTSFPEQAVAFYLSRSFDIIQRNRLLGFEIDVFLKDYNIGIEYDGRFFHSKGIVIAREKEKNSFFEAQGIKLIRIKENSTRNTIDGDTVYFSLGKKHYLDERFNAMIRSLLGMIENITGVSVDFDVDIVRDELAIREKYASIIKDSSVAAVFPFLVSEWDVEKNNGLLPENFAANASTKVWWKCKEGHSWKASISSRNRKLGCPFCAGQRTITGKNDFASWCNSNAPELLLEWDYDKNILRPEEVGKTSNKKAWWKCSAGHEWEAVIANRVHGTRCPICFTGNDTVRRKVSFAEWCKENDGDVLLKEWDYIKNAPLTPNMLSKGSHQKVWWKCAKGHEWEAQVKSRTYNHGCPFCSSTNKRAVIGKNDLVTWCKENNKSYILDEWDDSANGDLRPEMFTFSSHKRINWICKNGHKWNAVIKERTKYKGNMCPVCRFA